MPLTELQKKVGRAVRAIPKGTVRSYGEIAAYVGIPGGARAVVRAMGAIGGDLPWWRVVRSDRTIAPQMLAFGQDVLLPREGVTVKGRKVSAEKPKLEVSASRKKR